MKVLATLWIAGDVHSYHNIDVPDFNEPGYYQQGVSLSAFNTRESKGLYEANQRGQSFVAKRVHVRWDTDDVSEKWMRENIKREVYEHASVWDFYKAIGYDHKKQRYVNK